MKHIAMLVLMAVVLSGCSSNGSGLQRYVMQPNEAPSDCRLMDYNGEEAEFLRDEYNWTGNPGSVDNHVFGEDGAVPVANMVALYRCGDSEAASFALQFADANQTNEFVGDDGGFCDEDDFEAEAAIRAGDIAVITEVEGDVDGAYDAVRQWSARVAAMAGVPDPCAGSGPEAEENDT